MNLDRELLFRFFNKETTLEEEKKIRLWIDECDEHRREFFRERQLFDAILLHGDPSYEKSRPRFYIPWHKVVATLSGIAAIVILTIITTTYFLQQSFRDEVMNTVTVPQGQRVHLTLSDGTKVWLNAKTKMEYPQSFKVSDQRIVKVDGEAYFEVTKNKKLPFSVLSGKVKIKVLGTKFNFKSYKEDESARVTLVEGSLNVGNIENNVRNVLLIPNQQAVINKKENRVTVKNVDAKSYAMWTHPKQEILDVIPSNVTGQPTASIRVPSVTIRNTLFFNEEPLSQIVRDLERAFNVKIEIKDRQLSTERFYGDFRNDETITEILDIMAANNNLYYTIDGDEIIISRK